MKLLNHFLIRLLYKWTKISIIILITFLPMIFCNTAPPGHFKISYWSAWTGHLPARLSQASRNLNVHHELSLWEVIAPMGIQWGSNGAPMAGNWKNNVCDVLSLFGLCIWKYIQIIGLKAPRNYSDQFWSDKISIWLCQNLQSPWCLDLWTYY